MTAPSAYPFGRRAAGIALGLLGWLGFLGLSSSPGLAEVLVGTGPIPMLRRFLSLGSGIFPFSLAELFVVAVVGRQIHGLVGGVQGIRSGSRGVLRTVAGGGLRLAQDAGMLLFLFYLLWGFQYARPGLEAQLGIEVAGEATAEEIEPLARRAVEMTNLLYMQIHGQPDGGSPTPSPVLSEANRSLEDGWRRVESSYGFPARVSAWHGRPKRFLAATPIMKRFGVAGMHFPFTGEALVLRDLPGALLGTDLAHEMAHQRGFAREDDANVMGFLVAAASDDPLVRYAAYNLLQRQLVSALQRVGPDAAGELSSALHPGVHRDARDLFEYWEPSRGVAGATATRVNDAMLRSHGIPEGVASYRGSVWIFIALARERGEDALFPDLLPVAVSDGPGRRGDPSRPGASVLPE